MGRLRTDIGRDPCEADGVSTEAGLAAKLESWRHDPDLCLIWAAFCTASPLTLADGISLAKTRRSAKEALQLLAGGAYAVGASASAPSAPSAPCPSLSEDSKLNSESGWLADVPSWRATARSACDALEPWQFSGFGLVARLAKSVHGEVHYVRDESGAAAVAKVVSKDALNMQAGSPEDSEQSMWFSDKDVHSFDNLRNEIAVLRFLDGSTETSPHMQRLFGAFEDATSLYMVTAYCEEGDLFERVAYGDPLGDAEKKRHIGDMLKGVDHLHRHNIGHRDISLENVLLRKGSCVLIDFGQAVQLKASDGTAMRYFVEAGKRMYRSPEMYVPRQREVQVICPAEGVPSGVSMVSFEKMRCEVFLPPNAVPGKPCAAAPSGYTVAPADVFACGVCAFVLLVGKAGFAELSDADPALTSASLDGGSRQRPLLLLHPTSWCGQVVAAVARSGPAELAERGGVTFGTDAPSRSNPQKHT
ncbi:unnamed protein product [Effrenium voratum]|nr:unnamed protein product [Effrenium voratum]